MLVEYSSNSYVLLRVKCITFLECMWLYNSSLRNVKSPCTDWLERGLKASVVKKVHYKTPPSSSLHAFVHTMKSSFGSAILSIGALVNNCFKCWKLFSQSNVH
jgi:hypothetical protein